MKKGLTSLLFGTKKENHPVEFNNEESFVLLPLRDMVLFPNTVIPVFIIEKKGIAAVEESLKRDYRIFASCHRKDGRSATVGTVVRIIQYMRLPDNTFRVVLQGEYRGKITGQLRHENYTLVNVIPIETNLKDNFETEGSSAEELALMRAVQRSFSQYAELSKKIGTETQQAVEQTDNPERLANLICNSSQLKVDKKLELLAIAGVKKRLEAILETLERENEIFGIQKNISGKVKSRMEKRQREYYLHEQLKEINKELGKDRIEDEFAEMEKNIEAKNPPPEVMARAKKEIAKLRKLQVFSPEAGVLRAYLEWINDLPWSEYSSDSCSLDDAEKILNEDHFGMKKAKDRIMEFIAVRQLLGAEENNNNDYSVKGPILCFVGPPGTGKTSLGKSVARALGRNFARISLGGLRDEAEIRGHRKTYVGALPGKIIQSMRKAGTMNPVILLDEVDKLSSDFRGDPANALLEVLDPEQNSSFSDHYIELPYDLSRVLFITTANSLHGIPYPLLDRMEIIEIPGYGENEKLSIAKQFLVPKEMAENGLSNSQIRITEDALRSIIRYWTMESGVRGLEREIARCIRRIARKAVRECFGINGKPINEYKKTVKNTNLEKLLGRKKYKRDVFFSDARIGVSCGLAWTESGGAIMPIESAHFKGNGELIITGNLGDVMKESARIALSFLRSLQPDYAFAVKEIGKTDFHVHVPEGAIPKDGPSAGIAIATSLMSTLCQKAPRTGIAMTGELTLTGRILSVGGLKEKLLAAIRNRIEKVILPLDNRDEWDDMDKDIRSSIEVEFADNAIEAFSLLFNKSIKKRKN